MHAAPRAWQAGMHAQLVIADTSSAVQGNKAAASETTEAADKDKLGVCYAMMFTDKAVELNMRVFASDKELLPCVMHNIVRPVGSCQHHTTSA